MSALVSCFPRHIQRFSRSLQSEQGKRKVVAMATASLQYDNDPKVVQPAMQHTATIIMLHGLGDTANGWYPVGQALGSHVPHAKWIFPTAPIRPISCNGGFKMTGWYDILEIGNIDSAEDEEGIVDAVRYVKELVAKEVAAGVPPERIVFGGFSQGGAIAMMLLRSDIKLAGILGLSTYLPLRNHAPVVSETGKTIPVFMGHGTYDDIVKFDIGEKSKNLVADLGVDVTWQTYPMAHSACDKELQDVAAFLKRVIP